MKNPLNPIKELPILQAACGIGGILVLAAGLPLITGGIQYKYDAASRICVWHGTSALTNHIVQMLTTILPHLLLSGGIAWVSWCVLEYVSDPEYAFKPIVSLKAVRSTEIISELGLSSDTSGSRDPSPRMNRSQTAKARAATTKKSTTDNRKLSVEGYKNKKGKKPSPSSKGKPSSGTSKPGYKGSTTNLGPSASEEHIQLMLDVQNQENIFQGHRTIAMLLLGYTIVNLPRWATLTLEYVLRVGFGMETNAVFLLVCTSVVSFLRCSVDSLVLWWKILSVRKIMSEC